MAGEKSQQYVPGRRVLLFAAGAFGSAEVAAPAIAWGGRGRDDYCGRAGDRTSG